MCLRKTFYLDTIPASVKAYLAADSKYWLWVNGKLVVFEGGLNRGPKAGAGYYDIVELREHLLQGQNTVAVLVWYWGNQGCNSVDSGKGGFLFQAVLEGQAVVSDQTWKVKTHPAYGPTEAPYPSYLYAGYNIGFDARMDIPDWYKNHYAVR